METQRTAWWWKSSYRRSPSLLPYEPQREERERVSVEGGGEEKGKDWRNERDAGGDQAGARAARGVCTGRGCGEERRAPSGGSRSAFPAPSQSFGSLTLHTTSANQSHELITAFSTFQKDGQEPGVTAPLHPQKPLDYFLQLFTLFSLRESAKRGRGGGSGANVLHVTTFQQDWSVLREGCLGNYSGPHLWFSFAGSCCGILQKIHHRCMKKSCRLTWFSVLDSWKLGLILPTTQRLFWRLNERQRVAYSRCSVIVVSHSHLIPPYPMSLKKDEIVSSFLPTAWPAININCPYVVPSRRLGSCVFY